MSSLDIFFELQNCVENSSHTSEPVLYHGSYTITIYTSKFGLLIFKSIRDLLNY